MRTADGEQQSWKCSSTFETSFSTESNCNATRIRKQLTSLSQDRAPYFQALKSYLEERPTTFHIPAHNHGLAAPTEFAALLTEWGVACDITEVLGLDDIHDSHSQCLEAEALAAECWGAAKTKFLVNGSTVGVEAMLWTVLNPGDLVIAPTSSHLSFYSSLLLSGGAVECFTTKLHQETLSFLPPTLEEVKVALAKAPKAKALFLTSPTYHGAACGELTEIVEFAHASGLLVLVDEAWGAHFVAHPDLPASAVSCGADMVVQSIHKMTAGLTQSALLHYDPKAIDEGRLHKLLRHLQTSSPSALLVSSIDCARRQLALQGRELWEEALNLAHTARVELDRLDGILCPGPFEGWDNSRWILQAHQRGYSGHDLSRCLRSDHRIQLEMSELHQALALCLPGQGREQVHRLVKAVKALEAREPVLLWNELADSLNALLREPGESVLTVRQAFHARTTKVDRKKAVDRICGELLYCYPPGVPVAYPGQRITENLVLYLETQERLGGSIQGGADPKRESILVVETEHDE